jgi:hypothetical protein
MSIKDRGFAAMTPEKQQAIASKGGKADARMNRSDDSSS